MCYNLDIMGQNSRETQASKSALAWLHEAASKHAVSLIVVYSIVIVSIALLGSVRLYDWARVRILQASPEVALQFPAANQSQPKPNNNANPVAAPANAANNAPANQVAAPLLPVINVLLLGTDERSDDPSPPRTDTMILLTLDPNTQTAGMLSFPRDLWVPIPNLGITNKINTAYMFGEEHQYPGGGAQLAKDTVSAFIGQKVDYYVHINFSGFIRLIDLIGGVDVVVPSTINDDQYPTASYGVETFHLDAGPQHLDGETALKYARTRHIDSDYGRARRQQELIRAVSDKVLRSDMILTLLSNAGSLLTTMRDSVDTDIPVKTQLELAASLQKSNLREIRQLVLDSHYGDENFDGPDGAWILMPDRSKIRPALAQFFNPPAQGPAGAIASADPSWVRVEVLNGTDQPGVAARTRDLLQAQGWHVVSISDADRNDYSRTIVINYGVPQALVEKVSTDLGLQPNLSRLTGMKSTAPIDVRIVVGKDILSKVKLP
ncbi:MAG: LCP family protein [Chloroflexi bacterium]|nr:LCP family protein [Chloroflexota bacterium]